MTSERVRRRIDRLIRRDKAKLVHPSGTFSPSPPLVLVIALSLPVLIYLALFDPRELWLCSAALGGALAYGRFVVPILGRKRVDGEIQDAPWAGLLVDLGIIIGGTTLILILPRERLGLFAASGVVGLALLTYGWMVVIQGWDPERD